MTPVELLEDHRTRPRNIGKLLNANAVGDIGSIVVGDALRFYIQVKDDRISAARFQVFNAQDQLAAASVATELAVGRTLDEAMALTPVDLCAHLGGLPMERLPPGPWGLEGLRAAVAVYRGEEVEHDEELDPLVCRCHGIPEETVRSSVKVLDLHEVDDVVNATGAGSACGSCRADLPRLISEAREGGKAKPATTTRARPAGRISVMHRITALVDGEVRPKLPAGAGLELTDLDGADLVVAVSGMDDDTRRSVLGDLERLLKEQIDPGMGVRG